MYNLTQRYSLTHYVLFLLCFYLRPIHRSHPILKTALHSSTRDEKPLVDGRINRSRKQIVSLRDGRDLVWVDTAGRTGNSQIGTTNFVSASFRRKNNLREEALQRYAVRVALATNEFFPCPTAFTDDIGGISGSGMSERFHRGEPRWILLTFCSCIRQRMQIGSQAFHPGFCRCGTTRWWPSRGQEDGARHPQYLNNEIITSHR